jgi:hypothetical protein
MSKQTQTKKNIAQSIEMTKHPSTLANISNYGLFAGSSVSFTQFFLSST